MSRVFITKYCVKCNKKFRTTTNKEFCFICRDSKSILTKHCIVCNTEFKCNKRRALYCSEKCRNKKAAISGKYLDFRKTSVENSLLSVLWGCRSRAKRRDVVCNVSDEEVLQLLIKQNGKCAKTGIILEPSKQDGFKNKNPYTVSIDRVNNSKGYTIDNIELVCTIFNLFKNSYDIKDVENICKSYIKYNNLKLDE